MTGSEILTSWLIIVVVNTAATLSPGPAFAMTVRNSMAYDRRIAILTTIGLGGGVGVIAFLVLFGFAALLSQSAFLFNLLKYLGAAYLVFIGIKALLAKPHAESSGEKSEISSQKTLSNIGALKLGLLTNLLNPKGIVFFTAVYAQFVAPDTPWMVLVLYGLTSIIIETTWFTIVAFILTDSRIKRRFMRVSHWIERLCGGLLLLLGVRLALTKSLG